MLEGVGLDPDEVRVCECECDSDGFGAGGLEAVRGITVLEVVDDSLGVNIVLEIWVYLVSLGLERLLLVRDSLLGFDVDKGRPGLGEGLVEELDDVCKLVGMPEDSD